MKRIAILILFILTFPIIYPQLVDSIIDIRDNQIYKVIKIGQQWWMKENLNIGNYVESIYTGSPHSDVSNNRIIEKYCCGNDTNNCNIYGGLYDWDEMMDYNLSDNGNPGVTRGVCPIGWHLPTDAEWTELIDFLGGEYIAGGKLKEADTIHWKYNPEATNESGFTALPGDMRTIYGGPGSVGQSGYWWSSSEENTIYAWSRGLSNGFSNVVRDHDNKKVGISVRCVIEPYQFGYLTISDNNLNIISTMDFTIEQQADTIVIINSAAGKIISISSINTISSVYNLNKYSSVLLPGDSIHLTITFNPSVKNIYPDTLFVKSDDPFDSLITIPLFGTFPLEILYTDSANISCYGYSDGTATITPSLGNPPYTYQWDNTQNTTDSTVTGLQANIYYHVTVTDNQGETVTDSIILSEPEQALNILSDYSDTICLHSDDGYISINSSGGTPPYDYTWSNGFTSQMLSGLVAGDYIVKVTDSNGCSDSASYTISSLYPYEEEKICIVTIDLATGKNVLVWEKTPDVGIDAYNIYRESTIGVYNKIGTVLYGELSVFKDTTANPESQSYLYKITVEDTCGNESLLASSKYHRPSFLQYVSSEGGVNLEWTDYTIQGVTDIGQFLTSYAIYRGTDSTGLEEYQVVGSINTYTDTDPNALKKRYYYRVAAILKEPCYPTIGKKADTSPYNHSMSNIEDNRIKETSYGNLNNPGQSIIIYPNPFSESTVIQFSNPEGERYNLIVTDLSGRIVSQVSDITTSELILERGELPGGLYLIELRGPDIYRGKIMIE